MSCTFDTYFSCIEKCKEIFAYLEKIIEADFCINMGLTDIAKKRLENAERALDIASKKGSIRPEDFGKLKSILWREKERLEFRIEPELEIFSPVADAMEEVAKIFSSCVCGKELRP
jgi:hypothetical protein